MGAAGEVAAEPSLKGDVELAACSAGGQISRHEVGNGMQEIDIEMLAASNEAALDPMAPLPSVRGEPGMVQARMEAFSASSQKSVSGEL